MAEIRNDELKAVAAEGGRLAGKAADALQQQQARITQLEEALRRRDEALLGLTVTAQTGDGPLRGRIVDIREEGVQLQSGEAWFEVVAWKCLADEVDDG